MFINLGKLMPRLSFDLLGPPPCSNTGGILRQNIVMDKSVSVYKTYFSDGKMSLPTTRDASNEKIQGSPHPRARC